MAIVKRTYDDLKLTQPFVVDIVGKVAIGSTGAVGTATGKGFVVTRTGAGLYTITITATNGVPAILWAHVDVVFATAGNTQTAKILTINATTGVVTIQTNDAGTVDVAADPPSGSILIFRVAVQNANYVG
jgi:hypothetical protein